MPPRIPRTSILLTLLRGTPLECRLVVGSLSGSAQITQVHILISHEVLKLNFLTKRFVIFFFFSHTCVRHVHTFIFLVSTCLVLIKFLLGPNFCRSMVSALPFGSTHNMGVENGVLGGEWERTKSITFATSQRSSKMLISGRIQKNTKKVFRKIA